MTSAHPWGPDHPLHIVRCHQTCWARPSQWECESREGAAVYLRHRDGGEVCVGPSIDEAIARGPIFAFDEGGWMVTLAEFASYLPDWITIEVPQVASAEPFSEEHLARILPAPEGDA